jgi:hypothetical protein
MRKILMNYTNPYGIAPVSHLAARVMQKKPLKKSFARKNIFIR